MGGGMVRATPTDILDLAKCFADEAEQAAGCVHRRVCISVVDAHGNPVLFRRMTGSSLVAITMAVRKAETAVALGMATADIRPLVQPGQPLYSLLSADGGRYVAFDGGIPIWSDGVLVMALGVSGGTPDEDAAIAAEAIQAVNSGRGWPPVNPHPTGTADP